METYNSSARDKQFLNNVKFHLQGAFFKEAEAAKTTLEKETLSEIMISKTIILQMPPNSPQ